jgi:hypothetical protein
VHSMHLRPPLAGWFLGKGVKVSRSRTAMTQGETRISRPRMQSRNYLVPLRMQTASASLLTQCAPTCRHLAPLVHAMRVALWRLCMNTTSAQPCQYGGYAHKCLPPNTGATSRSMSLSMCEMRGGRPPTPAWPLPLRMRWAYIIEPAASSTGSDCNCLRLGHYMCIIPFWDSVTPMPCPAWPL